MNQHSSPTTQIQFPAHWHSTPTREQIGDEPPAYTPLAPYIRDLLLRLQAVHHPGASVERTTIAGYSGPYFNPERPDSEPVLWIRPDTASDFGAYYDAATGDTGTVGDLADTLGVNRRLGMVPPHLRHKVRQRPRVARRSSRQAVQVLLCKRARDRRSRDEGESQ